MKVVLQSEFKIDLCKRLRGQLSQPVGSQDYNRTSNTHHYDHGVRPHRCGGMRRFDPAVTLRCCLEAAAAH